MNAVILIGRMVADPELKITQNGTSVCTFRIAVDRRFAGQDGQRQADFITCVAWRQTAEFVARCFTKGKPIGVQGSLQSRSYEDQQGNKRTAYEVVCDQVQFAGPKEDRAVQPAASPVQPAGRPMSAQERPPQQTRLNENYSDYGGFEEITPDEDLPF